MIVAPYDVCYIHGGVVYHNAEVVCRPSVGPHYDKIVKLCIVKDDPPLDMVINDCLALERHLEADCRLSSRDRVFNLPAPAVIFGYALFSKRLFSALFKLFGCAIAVVCLIFLKQSLDMFFVDMHPLGLTVRSLVPVKSEPLHTLDNCLYGFVSRAGLVCVFDAQDEYTFVVTGEQPVKQGCPDAAGMEGAGRGRGKY